MTVGRTPPDKATIDGQSATLLINLDQAFANAMKLKTYLDATVDANLIALGYTQGEVNTLKSAYTDLKAAYDTWTGASVFTPARDLRAFAKLIWGTGI